MLGIMCEERGAKFFLPSRKFMGDNGSMIAYTGLIMLKSGATTPLTQSKVRPGCRTDDVAVIGHDNLYVFRPCEWPGEVEKYPHHPGSTTSPTIPEPTSTPWLNPTIGICRSIGISRAKSLRS